MALIAASSIVAPSAVMPTTLDATSSFEHRYLGNGMLALVRSIL